MTYYSFDKNDQIENNLYPITHNLMTSRCSLTYLIDTGSLPLPWDGRSHPKTCCIQDSAHNSRASNSAWSHTQVHLGTQGDRPMGLTALEHTWH